jgi:hypothetical protein
MTGGERMGWLRVGIGAAMVAAPTTILAVAGREEPAPTAVLLLRTIGIRDVAIGLGVVSAARSGRGADLLRWTRIALLSDSLDVAASVAARRSIGTRDAAAAALLGLLAALGDAYVLRSMRAGAVEPGP